MRESDVTQEDREFMQGMADSLPCACGKRQTAKPQLPASKCEAVIIDDELAGRSIKCLRQEFCCGVCKNVHPLARRQYIFK